MKKVNRWPRFTKMNFTKKEYQTLVEMMRREKMAGATVFRGILGFGAKSHLHAAHILRLSQDMPVLIEVIDTQDNIDRILPEVEKLMGDGLITIDKVNVLRYHAEQTEEQ